MDVWMNDYVWWRRGVLKSHLVRALKFDKCNFRQSAGCSSKQQEKTGQLVCYYNTSVVKTWICRNPVPPRRAHLHLPACEVYSESQSVFSSRLWVHADQVETPLHHPDAECWFHTFQSSSAHPRLRVPLRRDPQHEACLRSSENLLLQTCFSCNSEALCNFTCKRFYVFTNILDVDVLNLLVPQAKLLIFLFVHSCSFRFKHFNTSGCRC